MFRIRFQAARQRVRARSIAALCGCFLAMSAPGLCGTIADTDGDGIPNSSDPDIDNDNTGNLTDRNVDGGTARSGPFAGSYVGDRLRNGDRRESDIDGDLLDDDDPAETDIDGDGFDDNAQAEADIDGDGKPDDSKSERDIDGDDFEDDSDFEEDIDGDGLDDDDPKENDLDGDGLDDGSAEELDIDGDGLADNSRAESDIDGDGFDDDSPLENDIDGDGLDDDDPKEEDIDGDGLDDDEAGEEDIDGDGRADDSPWETDIDGDGLADDSLVEQDIDGDGLGDDSLEEDDIDGDGLDDDFAGEADIDGDGLESAWDDDDDGDGSGDAEEVSRTGFWEAFDDTSRWPDGAMITHGQTLPVIGIPWRISIAVGGRPTIVHALSGLAPNNGNTLFYTGGSANSSGGKMTLAFEATPVPTDAFSTGNQDFGCNVSFLNYPQIIADNGLIDPTGVVHTSFNGAGTTGPSMFQGEAFTCLTRAPVGGLYFWNARRTSFATNKRQTIAFQVDGDYLTITAVGVGSLVFHHPDLSTKLAADKTHFWWEPSGTVAPADLQYRRKMVLHRVTDNPDLVRSSSVTPGIGAPASLAR